MPDSHFSYPITGRYSQGGGGGAGKALISVQIL